MNADLQHATLPATLASQDTNLWQVYLRCRGSNGGKDILKFVNDVDDFRAKATRSHIMCVVVVDERKLEEAGREKTYEAKTAAGRR